MIGGSQKITFSKNFKYFNAKNLIIKKENIEYETRITLIDKDEEILFWSL